MPRLILVLILLAYSPCISQTTQEIGLLLDEISITHNSKDIIYSESGMKLKSYGTRALPVLAEFFTDSNSTQVYSDCNERKLTRGEIAIIMADRIEFMPYAHLTGVQNCLFTFCEGNPNLIEYYLNWISTNDELDFPTKYKEWLKSRFRKEIKREFK